MWSWRADGRVGGGLGQRLEGWCGKKQTKLAGVDTEHAGLEGWRVSPGVGGTQI